MSYSVDRFAEHRCGRADQSVWDRPYRCFRLPRNHWAYPTASVWVKVSVGLNASSHAGHANILPAANWRSCPPVGSHPNCSNVVSSFLIPTTNSLSFPVRRGVDGVVNELKWRVTILEDSDLIIQLRRASRSICSATRYRRSGWASACCGGEDSVSVRSENGLVSPNKVPARR